MSQDTWCHMWVIATRSREGFFIGMEKVAGQRFYLSADEAFEALGRMDPKISEHFRVFEVPILRVREVVSAEDSRRSL